MNKVDQIGLLLKRVQDYSSGHPNKYIHLRLKSIKCRGFCVCVCVWGGGGSKLEAKLSRSRDTILSMAESQDEKYMGSKKWFKIERHNQLLESISSRHPFDCRSNTSMSTGKRRHEKAWKHRSRLRHAR